MSSDHALDIGGAINEEEEASQLPATGSDEGDAVVDDNLGEVIHPVQDSQISPSRPELATPVPVRTGSR
jgi:hypothetical protein